MANVIRGIIISVKGLSRENACSKFSYIKKKPNSEKAAIAYINFF
jgi:hypothetical protein